MAELVRRDAAHVGAARRGMAAPGARRRARGGWARRMPCQPAAPWSSFTPPAEPGQDRRADAAPVPSDLRSAHQRLPPANSRDLAVL